MVNTQLKRIVAALSEHKIRYVIIGGHAVNAHGHVRATEDTDVIFQRPTGSAEPLLFALQELNACWIGMFRCHGYAR